MIRTMMMAALVVSSLGWAADAPPPQKTAEAPKAKDPDPTLATQQGRMLSAEKVSARVRETLKRKMKNHSKDFQHLPMAIVFADYAEVARLTQHMINEPRLDKASTGDELAGLSNLFWQLQDQLRERATALNAAAIAKDVNAMSAGLGNVANTCATCHAVFREPMMRPASDK